MLRVCLSPISGVSVTCFEKRTICVLVCFTQLLKGKQLANEIQKCLKTEEHDTELSKEEENNLQPYLQVYMSHCCSINRCCLSIEVDEDHIVMSILEWVRRWLMRPIQKSLLTNR
jgi:hypothetical protein